MGAESSGKTTLAKELAQHYHTWWVPEYGRYYWDAKHLGLMTPIWRSEEFIHIATMQNQIEDHYAGLASGILLIDTDAFMTAVWHYRYLGIDSPELALLWQNRHRDLILFCAPDFPFVQDGTRDGELIRPDMASWIRDRLTLNNFPFIELCGPREQRLAHAVAAIDALVKA
jgi:NadR type nicotinamide-nucleotide adenylyltransferase